MKYKIDPGTIKGFIEPKEGEALYQYALEYSQSFNCLEIGSYCGKSAVYIGTAVKKNSRLLYSIDHHRGSEEQQPNQEYYDPDLINDYGDGINTLDAIKAYIDDIEIYTSGKTLGFYHHTVDIGLGCVSWYSFVT